MMKGRHSEAMKSLEKIAKINKKEIEDDRLLKKENVSTVLEQHSGTLQWFPDSTIIYTSHPLYARDNSRITF